ncbi:MAG: hypothetical protein ACI9MC_000667 [Kiritimatiellia bacterium]|jgi:hypothetical protein
MQEPLVQVMQQLQAAAMSDDPTQAEQFCTQAGWNSRADSARRLVRSMHQGDQFKAIGPCFITGDPKRAALRCEFVSSSRSGDTAWWLFVEESDGWKIEAFAQNKVLVGLFLEGVFSPLIGVAQLASHSGLATFADGALADLREGRAALPDKLQDQSDVVIESLGWFEPLARGMIVFEYRKPGNDWGSSRGMVLQLVHDEWVILERDVIPGWRALLNGAQVSWDLEPTGADVEARMRSLLDQVLEKSLAALGLTDGLPEGGARALIAFMEGLAPQDTPAPFFDAQSVNAAWGDDLEERVTRRVQVAVGDYLQRQGVDAESLDPDSPQGQAVLEEHGSEVMRILFASILASVGTHTLPDATDAPHIPAIGRWVRAALAAATSQPPGEA